MQWYYTSNGTQQGPVSIEQLKSMIASGSIRTDDFVWKEGMSAWEMASSVAELRLVPSLPAAAPPLPPANPFSNPYQPPMSPVGSQYGQEIPNYLWQAITVTVLCCLPFGIPAIVYAAKVDGLAATGNIQAARKASDSA